MGLGWWVAMGAAAVWPVLAWVGRRRKERRAYTEWQDGPEAEAGACVIAVGAPGHHVVQYVPEGEEGSVVFAGNLTAGVHLFPLPEEACAGSWRVEAPYNTVVRRVRKIG